MFRIKSVAMSESICFKHIEVAPKVGYLYAMRFNYLPENVYKVGRTVNIKSRMTSYSCGHLDKPEISITSKQLPDNVWAEKQLFEMLSEYKFEGKNEMFAAPIEKIAECIKVVESEAMHNYIVKLEKELELKIIKITELQLEKEKSILND